MSGPKYEAHRLTSAQKQELVQAWLEGNGEVYWTSWLAAEIRQAARVPDPKTVVQLEKELADWCVQNRGNIGYDVVYCKINDLSKAIQEAREREAAE